MNKCCGGGGGNIFYGPYKMLRRYAKIFSALEKNGGGGYAKIFYGREKMLGLNIYRPD